MLHWLAETEVSAQRQQSNELGKAQVTTAPGWHPQTVEAATLTPDGSAASCESRRIPDIGHAAPAFTMATYQHVLPGMQAVAGRALAALLKPTDVPPVPPGGTHEHAAKPWPA